MFIALKPLDERKVSADQVIGRLRGKLAGSPGATLFLQAAQDSASAAAAGNAQYQYTLQGDNLDDLNEWAPSCSSDCAHCRTRRRQQRSAEQRARQRTDHDRSRHGVAAWHHRRS